MTKKLLMKRSVSLLIGLSICFSSCRLFTGTGDEFEEDYYEVFFTNKSNYSIYVEYVSGIKDGFSERSTGLKLVEINQQHTPANFPRFDVDPSRLQSNIRGDFDFVAGSKFNIYIDDVLVKTWYSWDDITNENINSPYSTNSWVRIDFKIPVVQNVVDQIFGQYIFTITDEDLDLSVLEETTVTEQDLDVVE